MQLYEHDALIRDERAGPKYVTDYRGFLCGTKYRHYQVFSSRRAFRGMCWPDVATRDMWRKIRETQFSAWPSGRQGI